MARLVQDGRQLLRAWEDNLQVDRANAQIRDKALNQGGGKWGWEGRRVGIDFFRNPKGPPDDLRNDKDDYPGRYGLAGEYMGDRELANPWAWNCVWEEMGMPHETRKALEREEKGRAGGRVVRDNGVYPAAQGDARQKEAEDRQMEANVERGKLLAERLAMLVQYDDQRDQVLQGRIRWIKSDGKWVLDKPEMIKDDNIVLLARRGCDYLNETPFYWDRPQGNQRPHRQHEMLSQLKRAPTIRDVDKIPRPNPPYAWGEEAEGYEQRKEWDIRNLLRGERRTVAERQRMDSQAVGGVEGGTLKILEGWGEGARSVALVGKAEQDRFFKVFHPGGKRWDGNAMISVPAAMITVRKARNRNFGLNTRLFGGEGVSSGGTAGDHDMEVELLLNPPAQEFYVFHHMGKLVAGEPARHGGHAGKQMVGGCMLPPDRRIGVVEADGYLGGNWKLGDVGCLGADGHVIGARFANVDGAGNREVDGQPVYAHVRRAGNANYGLNKGLLAPPPPQPGERPRLADLGGGNRGCVFQDVKMASVNRRPGRRDISSVSANNTYCER